MGRGYFSGPAQLEFLFPPCWEASWRTNTGVKPIVVSGVLLFGLFSLSTLLAKGLDTLIAARFLTGLGLGAAMPAVIAYASDHSPENMKKRAVGFIYCAIPIGGLLSGAVMQAGVFGSDWRPVYLVGGIAPIIIAPFLFLLPKSRARTLNSSELTSSQWNILSGLLGKGQFNTTIFLWIANFGTLLVMYLLLGWMPSLLVAMGLSQPQSQYVQMLYNVGMSIGAAAGGYLLDRKLPIFNAGHSLCCIGSPPGSLWISGA